MNQQLKRMLCMLCMLAILVPWVSASGAATEVEENTYSVDTESAVYAACEAVAETIQADQILVYDVTTDEILYSKTVEGGKLYPASTTKLFSAYVALQHLEPGTVITAGDELDLMEEGSSIAWITKGHKLTVDMLVEGMLLPSGNDAALMLAAGAGKAIAGDETLGGIEAVQVFVDEMNRMAEELGFEKSQFTNPHGFHVGAHYTCINDMARMAKLAMGNSVIRKHMAVFEADVLYASGHSNHWINTNQLLNPESEFYFPGTLGMKTGRTSQAGYCLMSAFPMRGHVIVVGVFGYEDGDARFRDVVNLLEAYRVTR